MKPLVIPSRPVLAGALLGLLLPALPLAAQVDVRVAVGKVQDTRSRYGTNEPSASLTLYTKLEGAGVEGAKGFRLTVTSAKDDAGSSLLPETREPPDWGDNPNDPDLWIKLLGPARAASTVTVAGTLEVYLPSRDPASEVRVEKVFARPGKPLASPGLEAAKVELYVVPREEVREGAFVLVGAVADMEKVRAFKVLRADGTEIEWSGMNSGSNGETTTVQLSLSEPAPPDAGLVLTLLTEKAVVSVPFELKAVPLP